MIKRRVYEVFLKTHLACAALAVYAIWKHTSPSRDSQISLLACLGTFAATGALQVLRIIYRNVVFGKNSVRMTIKPYPEDIIRVTLYLPRPWSVRAGERINLSVPFLGVFYLFQTHPFSVAWWENNTEGEADTICLMFRARTGFTRKVLECMKPNRQYWAWINGPFGPSFVHRFGTSKDVSDYGHVLMVTTGIGIAAQIPYIKELLYRCCKADVRTQRITLVWQSDRTGDWESVRDWLQQLVKGYMLKVTVYDPLGKTPPDEPEKVGHHELITIHSGEVNWQQELSEMQRCTGKLLVTGNDLQAIQLRN